MPAPTRPQRGFTYLGLLFAVVIIGLMLTVAARVWLTTVQREHEAQLLWVGHAYRMAIASYVALGHQYPPTLDVLLKDDRFPVPKRHLRQLYPDPMTGKADWKLIMNPTGVGIMGVASSSQVSPIKRDGFEKIDVNFKNADCYCKWQFVYLINRWGAVPSTPTPFDTPVGQPPGSQGSGAGGQGGAPGTINPYPTQPGPSGSSGH